MSDTLDVPPSVLAEVHQLYGEQSHWIDGGDAARWAATFTEDGEFHSPSYPDAVVGRAELTAFARRFHEDSRASGQRFRHVLTNLFVEAVAPAELRVRGYLQIVATPEEGAPRVVRFTTITDDVVGRDGRWLVRRRTVRRDDAD